MDCDCVSNDVKPNNNFLTGAAQCLGEIYHLFGRKITAGLIETSNIVGKLMKYHEVCASPFSFLIILSVLIPVPSTEYYLTVIWYSYHLFISLAIQHLC